MDKQRFHDRLFKTGNSLKVVIKEHIFKVFDFELTPGANNTSGIAVANELREGKIDKDKVILFVKFGVSSKIEESDQKMFELVLLYKIVFDVKDIQNELNYDEIKEFFNDQKIMKDVIKIIWPYSREILQRNCLNADIPVITLPVI